MKKTIDRRQFVSKSLFAGISGCLGCSSLFALTASAQDSEQVNSFQTKIQKNTEMTYNQIFTFAYRDCIIPQLVELSQEIGQDKFQEMLKKATDNVYSQPGLMKKFNSNLPSDFWNNVLDLEVVENTANTRTYKVTNCLWAKVFLEAKAGDI